MGSDVARGKCHGWVLRRAWDARGWGRVFYIDEQDGQDFELDGNGITAWFDRLTMSGCANGDDRGLRISPSPQPSPIEGEGEGTGFYIDEQDGQDFELDGNGITAWFDRLTMSGCANGDDRGLRISPSPQPSPIEGEGEGTGFYIDEQDGQDFELEGNGIAAWFDRLTMSGCANGDDRGLRISPSPQPSPIEGEGEGTGFYIDEQDGQDFELDGNGIAALVGLVAGETEAAGAPAGLFVDQEGGGVAAKGCFQIHVEALPAKLPQQLEALLGVQAAFVIGALYIAFVFAGQIHFHSGHHQVIPVFVVKKIGGA